MDGVGKVGWITFEMMSSKRAAEEKEAQYIEDYRAQYGENPPGNQ
jgi:hypothetical protein